jgi:hypothetical protein
MEQIKRLYKEILEREEFLKNSKQTPNTEARLKELTLCIIRIQQILLEELNDNNRQS